MSNMSKPDQKRWEKFVRDRPARGLGMPVQKAKNFKGTIKRLANYLRPDKYRFLLVFLLAIASTLIAILGPKILGMATTKLAEACWPNISTIFS